MSASCGGSANWFSVGSPYLLFRCLSALDESRSKPRLQAGPAFKPYQSSRSRRRGRLYPSNCTTKCVIQTATSRCRGLVRELLSWSFLSRPVSDVKFAILRNIESEVVRDRGIERQYKAMQWLSSSYHFKEVYGGVEAEIVPEIRQRFSVIHCPTPTRVVRAIDVHP